MRKEQKALSGPETNDTEVIMAAFLLSGNGQEQKISQECSISD